jgi:nucleotide-binding universal stress UspA family protein
MSEQMESLSRVLCGIDGSDADADAVRQAAVLAGPEGQLEIVCVMKASAADQAEQALESAQAIATEVGTPTSARVESADDVWTGLAGATAERDLLVLGDNPDSRSGGIFHTPTSTRALHDSPIPVLIARAGAGDFPQRIVVASDGGQASIHATAIAAAIARAHSSAVTMVTIGHVETREHEHALHEEAAELTRALGVEPTIVLRTGEADEEIVAVARQAESSLLVMGSRGKHGIRALGSVSEKVAHNAPCSVLVARRSDAR